MKKKLILVLIALLMLIPPAAALADTGGTVDTTVTGILIENAVTFELNPGKRTLKEKSLLS